MFIVTKKIDSENISKVCRTCLREDNDKMLYLFIGPSGSSLAAKLQSLSCLEVHQGDGLPEKMCDKCVTRAESALLFREQCRAADQALRQAAVQVSKEKAYLKLCESQMNQHLESQSYNHNIPKLTDYRTLPSQDLYDYNCWHPPLYRREENRSIDIVEQNSYLNLSRYSYGWNNHELLSEKDPAYSNPEYNSLSRFNDVYNRPSCALQCSLCNYTFMDKTQLENHSRVHNSDDLDSSNDEINVEDNFSTVDKCTNYERTINYSIENTITNTSCCKINSNSNGYHNLSFISTINPSTSKEIHTINPIVPQNSNLESFQKMTQIIENNRFKCDICSRLFNEKSKLMDHQLTHGRKKPFECLHCGKSYSSKSKLAAHIRLHTRTNIYQCNICQKIFSYPSYLNDHMKTHTIKLPEKKQSFECNQCNKKFNLLKSYKRHLKFHTGKDLYHCDICDKLFTQKYTLKVHMHSHQQAKFYKCNLCDKSFNQKSNLVEHTRIHTKVKPFKCKQCQKTFAQSSHLKSHELSHNSIRQFNCRICGKRFKLGSHLKRHMNMHTGLKMFKCEQCNQMFSQSFSLKRHMKKHLEI